MLRSPRSSLEVAAENAVPRKAESLLSVCAVLGTAAVLVNRWCLATFPYQVDYGEGLMLEGALSLRQGRPLYPAASQLPVVLHVYGPLAYAATAATLRPGHISFTSGRVLVLLCALGLSTATAGMLRRWAGSLRIGVAFGLILLTMPAFRFWTYLLRADLIGVAMSVSGLALFALKPRYKHWSVIFFTAALFCKYSLLAAPVAVFLHLLLTRQFKDAARFVMLQGLACGAVFAVFQIKTGGGFAFHIFSTHPDPHSFAQLVALTGLVWLSAAIVTGMALFHVLRKIYNYVANANSPRVLSQSLGPLLLSGKPVLLTHPFVYGQLVQHGIWSDSGLVRLVNEHYFDVILTTVDPAHVRAADGNIWPPSLWEAMGRHYRVVKSFRCRDSSLILEPGP